MKFKNVVFIVFALFICPNAMAQKRIVGLKESIKLALANKSSILALKSTASIDSLNSIQLKAKYLPQISIAYDYMFNPIIRTNIVPTGKFNQIPTDEVRAIKFGTNFNQTGGIQILQPIFNASIKSRIDESNLLYRIKQAEINSVNKELEFEVAQSFIKILLQQKQLNEIAIDTLRTAQTLSYTKERFVEGNTLKTELNKAQINHNSALFLLKELISDLVIEKIYFGFLTNLPVNQFDVEDRDSLLIQEHLNWLNEPSNTNVLPQVQENNFKIDLVKQQIKNEKIKYQPTVSANGYLGVDQFSNKLNPFQSNSWFGNSFIGISAKLPILIGEDKKNKLNQYQSQIKALNFQSDEVVKSAESNKQSALQELSQLKVEYSIYKTNVMLYKENLNLYKERLQAGLETINTVNLEEVAYQKEMEKLNIVDSKMWQYWLAYLKNAGMMHKIYQ